MSIISYTLALAMAFAMVLAPASALPATKSADMTTLATSKNCLNCHAIDRKTLGPAFTEIAKKYQHVKNAKTTLSGKIVNGSKGEWGVLQMPANTNVTPAEAKQLAGWILSMKKK